MNRLHSLIAILILLIIGGCQTCSDEAKPPQATEVQPLISAPVFNVDSAYYFIEKQLSFGPRVPGTEAHSDCATWMAEKISEYADNVIVQNFQTRIYDGRIMHGKNIIAEFDPEKKSRILLCAHWDSRAYADHDPDPANHRKPIDGANDGASGIGVLMEIARLISMEKPNLGIDIIFFDLEDYGEPQDVNSDREDNWALGSQYWARNPHKINYNARFGILLDMVGAENATFTMEGTSMYYAPDIMRKVWRTAHNLGYRQYFIEQQSGAITDDHLYVNKIIGIPTINIIHYETGSRTGFFKHWHTVNDNIDVIDKTTLSVVGHTVLTVIYNER